jgi:lauroyl/myristoyl acyltransferase
MVGEGNRRRRVPSPVAVALAVARGRRLWRDPESRARARAAIVAIVGDVPERDALARAHLIETAVREELIWRPWQLSGARFEGREHLEHALAQNRGAIASFVHTGPVPGVAISLAEVRSSVHAVAADWPFAPITDDAAGRRRAQWRANLDAAGISLVSARGSYARIAELLRRGELVLIAFDMVGRQETRFSGRGVRLASGTARLAFETGAPVVPVWRARDRWRPFTVAAPALDPADHATWQDVHAALAAIHTRWILARPAALEDPCRPGWWGASGPESRR